MAGIKKQDSAKKSEGDWRRSPKVGCFLVLAVFAAWGATYLPGCDHDGRLNLALLGGTTTTDPTPTASAEKTPEDLQKDAKKVAYQKALPQFLHNLSSEPDVVKAEAHDDDRIWVTIAGEHSDYDARAIQRKVHQAFAIMRSRYFSEDEAKGCSVYIYDDTGKEIAGESI